MLKSLLAPAAAFLLLEVPIAGEPPQREAVIARARPAVVFIQTTKVTGAETTGSGFIFDPAGYILTNHHVIEASTAIRVTLSDGRTLPATVAGYKRIESDDMNRVEDVAVLKIDAQGLPTLWTRFEGKLAEGQELLVLGFPGRLDSDRMSVTRGIVSAVRTGWIQTDAVIVPGNSGGPVIDAAGRVVGIATFRLGYELRFGGVMWIDKAYDLASWARTPGVDQMRIIDVPGLEYFKPRDPTSNVYSSRHMRTWKLTINGAVSEQDEEIEAEGNLYGASKYNHRRPFAISVEDYAEFLAGTTGYFDMSRRMDATWVRRPTPPLKLAGLPLIPGASSGFEETWTRDNRQDLAQAIGAPPRPSSLDVRGETIVESTTARVTVPAGTFVNCVLLTTEVFGVTNLGGREHWVTKTWYAPNFGEVRRSIDKGPSWRSVRELREIRWIY